MDDFRRKPINRVAQPSSAARPTPPTIPQPKPANPETPKAPISPQPIEPTSLFTSPKKPKNKRILKIIASVMLVIVVAIASIAAWYTMQLAPVDSSNKDRQVVKIEVGTTPSQIAELLKEEGLIRDRTAFLWNARFKGVQNQLKAGTYRLSPSESTPEIIDHLSSGKGDTINVTFLPGETVAEHKKVLVKAGYEPAEIDAAFAKTYDSPLFEGKPATADLEGYIYGETYTFGADTSVEAILQHTFDHYYQIIQKHDLVAKFKAQGLSLYQGITLASIVQREAGSFKKDMPQIAQVFYTRLSIDMQLGSDVTYQYAADKMGVPRDVNLDSPYNTRRYPGLPPGPIASPGEEALLAVANPASGDYIYFLSGDDNVTYFARTLQEHEANIRNHCQEKCQII